MPALTIITATDKPGESMGEPIKETVCGGRLGDESEAVRIEYQGQVYYVCHAGCRRAFEADPERFLAGEIEHPPAE